MSKVQNVAILGASGSLGSHITNALLKTGRFTVTAISREESKATFPAEVKVTRGDLNSTSFLESALKNQHVLISTPAFGTDPSLELRVFDAAAKAGVPWILPNDFGSDVSSPKLQGKGIPVFDAKIAATEHIEKLGVAKWIGTSLKCNF